ncbi:MAG: nucleotide triphosphate diphosphatase NUDT15 [Acidimicrobiales bacterium]
MTVNHARTQTAGGTNHEKLVVPGPSRVAFCRRCGGTLQAEQRGDRARPVCGACGSITFHNPAVGVAVVVRDEAGRVLMGRRSGSYGGQWCIPCGYVEWDEDVRLAATREFLEETGLEVELGAVVAVHSNFHNADQHTVGIWFAGVVVGGVLAAADDLDAVDFFEAHLPPDLAFPTDALVLAQLAAESHTSHDQALEGSSGRSWARPDA